MNNPTVPTPVTDKNGKKTTVHKKVASSQKSSRALPNVPVQANETFSDFRKLIINITGDESLSDHILGEMLASEWLNEKTAEERAIYNELSGKLDAVLTFEPDTPRSVNTLAVQTEFRAHKIADELAALWTTPEFEALGEDAHSVIHDALNGLQFIAGASSAIMRAIEKDPQPIED